MNAEDEERVELRLLTEPEFAERFDIAVEDLTDAYVAGEIEGEDRERAETYFFKSAERQNKLKYAQALKTYKSQRITRTKWWTSPKVRIAASIILIVGIALPLWWALSRPDDVDKGLLALQEAYRQERPFDARISGLRYAPTPSLSFRGEVKVDEPQRKRAESLLEIAVQDHRTAKSLHGQGQSYLAARKFDEAISRFEEALKLSDDAKIHSDLGAALLEKGKREPANSNQGKRVESFSRAVTHLTRALELDGSLLEALFNRALTFEHLGAYDTAERDWRLYLEKDPNSQWAAEAREHLKSVEGTRQKTSQTPRQIIDEFVKRMDLGEGDAAWKIVRENQHRRGNTVVEHLLDNYLERGNDIDLNRLASIADMDRVKNGDHFYSDVLAFYRSANPQQRELVKQAREFMKRSHAGWGQNPDESLSLFTDAKNLFQEAGDVPEAKHADYWIAFSYYLKKTSHPEIPKIIDPLISACNTNNYLWLKVRCMYLRSNNEFALNRHSTAVASAREAATLAEDTSDAVGLLNVITSLVDYYRYLGNYPKVLGQIQRALPILNSTSLDAVQSSRHYAVSAVAFAAMGFDDAALNYQEEALQLAQGAGPNARMAYHHAFLGAIQGKRRQFDAALSSVSKASEIATAHSVGSLMAYSALQRANIYREMGDCDKAVASYTQSIDLYEDLKFETNLYHAHKGRLLCYLAQKDDARAQYEIAITLPLIEKNRTQISEENNRNTFFEIEQTVYDLAIDFEASRMNNPDRAFAYVQESRGRTLLDLLSSRSKKSSDTHNPEDILPSVTQPESAATIKEKLSEDAQLVQYAVLDDKILIWVISRQNEVTFKPVSVSKSVLNETIARYLQVVSQPSTNRQEEQSLAKKLYSVLIQPVAAVLDPNKLICVIPDKNLSYLPFTALLSPDSGKYLIEEYVLTTSQSPSVFLVLSKNALEKSKMKHERLLSVGNPQFDREAFPQLDDLPNAKQEALEIMPFYDDPVPLVEGNATVAAVKPEMIRSDVVHLAMHSVLDGELPSYSKLLLAKAGSASDLHAYEIYRMDLPRTRLVVLSSCQSGAEHYYDGEGMASLARAFLSARVPLVVASLWPVDSKATEKLMVSFHRQRSQKRSTAEALATAQREMLSDPENRYRSPFYWAAFALNGGYAEF